MSNIVAVRNDSVVACGREAAAGSGALLSTAGAATLAFADAAPLVKVKEELAAQSDVAGASLTTASSCDQESLNCTSGTLVAWLNPALERVPNGEASELTGQGRVVKVIQDGAKPATEGDPEAILGEGLVPMEAGVAGMSVATVLVAADGEVVSQAEPALERVGLAVEARFNGGETVMAGGSAAFAPEGNGSDKAAGEVAARPVHVGQGPVASSLPQGGMAAYTVGDVDPQASLSGTGLDTSAQVAGDGTTQVPVEDRPVQLPDAPTGLDRVPASYASYNSQVSDVAAAVSSDQMLETQQMTSPEQAGQGTARHTEFRTHGDESGLGGQNAQVASPVDGGQKSPVNVPAPVDRIGPEGPTVQSDGVVAGGTGRSHEVDAFEAPTAPIRTQQDPVQQPYRSDSGGVGPERQEGQGQTPGLSPAGASNVESSTGKTLIQETQAGEVIAGVRTSETTGQGQGASLAGAEEATRATSEVSVFSEDGPSSVSTRPSESVWNSPEGEATPFRSSAENVGQQISDSVQMSLRRGDKELVVRLNPPELGSVSVRLEEKGDVITGVLEVGRSETRREIEQALPQVLQSLQEAGVQIRRLDLTVTDQQGRDVGRDQLQHDASGQQGSDQDSEGSEATRGSGFSGATRFRQSVLATSEAEDAQAGWSRDGIDMLM